jgi:hypothetical protein
MRGRRYLGLGTVLAICAGVALLLPTAPLIPPASPPQPENDLWRQPGDWPTPKEGFWDQLDEWPSPGYPPAPGRGHDLDFGLYGPDPPPPRPN